MKTITTSQIFKALAEVSKFNSTLGTLATTPTKIGYVQPARVLNELKTINDIYNTPSKTQIINNFINGLDPNPMNRKVVLLRDKEELKLIPRSIPFWQMKSQAGRTVFCNITPYVKAKKILGANKAVTLDNNVEPISLPVPILYTFLEMAYIQENITDNIAKQTKILKGLAAIYARLAVNILERNYGLTSSPSEHAEVQAAFAVYFCFVLMEKDMESSIAIAKSILPLSSMSNFNTTRVTNLFKGKDDLSFYSFIDNLAGTYLRLKKLTPRLFISAWTNDYGEAMILALEVPIYLIFNISSVLHNANLNNEFRIVKLIDNNVLGQAYLELMRSI